MEKFHTIAISAVITLALGTGVVAENLSKDDYKAARDRIETTYRADKRRCDSMSGNAKDICSAEAVGREKLGKAELEARHNPTNEMRYEAQVVKAETDYEVAKEKCDDLNGNMNEVCLKEAEAARTSAKADARAELEITAAYSNDDEEAVSESKEAYREAADEKNEAEFELAAQKCQDFDGPARKLCLDNAKTQHGM
jgi:hypothetical protein